MHMRLGLGLTRQQGGGPSISDLFASNAAKGFALDASPAYLWQDAARTTAVTTPGQTVLGVTDVSGQGNHLSEVAAGPIYGVKPFRGRVNTILNNRWDGFTAITLPNGATTFQGVTLTHQTGKGITATIVGSGTDATTGIPYLDVSYVGTGAASTYFANLAGNNDEPFTAAASNIVSGYVALVSGVQPGANTLRMLINYQNSALAFISQTSASIASIASTLTRYTCSGTSPALTAFVRERGFFVRVGVGEVVNFTIRVGGLQHEKTASATALQLTTASGYNCTETGQSTVHYLRFQTSKFLQTAAIDFSDRDCVAVVAGLRKMADAAQGVVAELTASLAANNGAFLLDAPASAASNFTFTSKGTVAAAASYTDAAVAAPTTAVITGQADISADSGILRRNGVQVATVATDQGTGNFSNAIVTVGARGGASLFLDAEVSSLVVFATAATISAADLSRLEAIAAPKCGVTL